MLIYLFSRAEDPQNWDCRVGKSEMSEKKPGQLEWHQVEELKMPLREGYLTELIISCSQTRRLMEATS